MECVVSWTLKNGTFSNITFPNYLLAKEFFDTLRWANNLEEINIVTASGRMILMEAIEETINK